ncbi:NfeD family protein [Phormidium tenue FACHB-886]|nr:NfeD family protein [Phormidium tenue FACHB-886]
MYTSKAPKTIKLFATAGLGEVYQTFVEGYGRIKFHGSFWRAQLHQLESLPGTGQSYPRGLTPGELVVVVGRVGLTLLVQPYDSTPVSISQPDALGSSLSSAID